MFRPGLPLWLPLLLVAAVAAGCEIKDESLEPNQLERLRVLGIRADPPDLVAGESATLSALVYEPDNEPVSYEWTWCMVRGDAEQAYGCTIDEAALQAAWNELNTGLVLPPYDLGSGDTATLDLVVSVELAVELCVALTADEPDRETALFNCIERLDLSIQLRATTDTEQVLAIKSIPVVAGDDERNANPEPTDIITVALVDGGLLAPEDPLRTGASYTVTAEVERDQSETFTPEPEPGLDPPEPRGESLFMTWFVTIGSTHEDGFQRTGFIDGQNDFEDLLENTWKMPSELDSDGARLFLVLRDERDGLGWIEHTFEVEEAQ